MSWQNFLMKTCLENIEEWLWCSRLSLNVLITNYMIFATKNKLGHDVNMFVNNVRIERVHITKFLGVQIDSKLNWKNHIEYTCKKCIGMIAKARRKLHKSSLKYLYYPFAFPYFIYCNHVWENTNLENIVCVQKEIGTFHYMFTVSCPQITSYGSKQLVIHNWY